MNEHDSKRKALEISHGLFRIAAEVREPHLKDELYRLSVELVRHEGEGDALKVLKTLELLEAFVMLGEAVGEIAYVNSQIIYRELHLLRTSIEERARHNSRSFDLQSIFSSLSDSSGNEISGNVITADAPIPEPNDSSNEEIKKAFHSQDRLNLVAERVAELGHAAMRDIIAAFPGVSERTIRYDLQKLCEQGIIERIGSGGPASYYRTKEVVPTL
jgi:hypothetical protein